MIDLNDVAEQPPEIHPAYHDDVPGLSRRLGDSAPSWVPHYLAKGAYSKDRRHWHLANTMGDAPRGDGSCVVELEGEYAGHHRDWSTGEHGDALETLQIATRLEGAELYHLAAEIVGAPAP